jgi:hypothetical protein
MVMSRPRIPAKRPIHENLLRQLALAQEYLKGLYELEADGCDCGYQIARTEREVEKLTRLTR